MRFSFFLIVAGIFFTVLQVNANLEVVTYPITELGNCESQEACFAYCNFSENYDACMAFAEAKELLSQEEIQEYREVQEVVAQGGGPGGCTSEFECESYCGDLTHIDECLSFAQEHGLMSEDELAEAQKVQAALDAGYTLPGGCTNEVSCESYCSDAAHMEECIAFGKAAGFMTEEEAVEAEKFLTIIESGGTPGDCQNQEECEAYCADGANADECLNFAVEAGFMTQEEADATNEMNLSSPEDFLGPGGCTDEENCRAYCELEEHREECQAFFGDIPENDEGGEPEEFVGPGGCVGEEACRVYCSDSANQETCAAFFGDMQGSDQWEGEPEESLGDEYKEYDPGQPQEYPSEEYQPEYGGESMPDYQYEGGQNYDIYEYTEEGSYGQDEFESFDPGDASLDFDQGWENHGSYDEIYVEPPSGYNEPPSYSEPPNSSESPGSSEPSFPERSGGEPHSAATPDAGFVESAREFIGKIITQTKQFFHI